MPIIPEYSPPPQAPYRPATPNPRVAAAPAVAAGELARNIADLGGSFGEISVKAQASEDARISSEMRGAWVSGAAELDQQLEGETDPGKFKPATDKFLEDQAKALENPNLSPVAKERLQADFADFKVQTETRAAGASYKLSQTRLQQGFQNDLHFASFAGDQAWPLFEKALTNAKSGGLAITPETETKLRTEFDHGVTINRLRGEIGKDPVEMERTLQDPDSIKKYPGLDYDDISGLRREAYQGASRARGEFWDTVLNASMNGADPVSRESLKVLAENGWISPEQQASYIHAYHSGRSPAHDETIYNPIFESISSYEPESDPTGAGLAHLKGEIAASVLPKEDKEVLGQKLQDHLAPVKPQAHKLSKDYATVTAAKFRNGEFGKWFTMQDTDGNPATPAVKVITPDDLATAQMTQRRFTDVWDSWLSAQPDDADPVKVKETYDQLFEKLVLDQDEAQAAPLIPSAPTVFDIGADVRSVLGRPAANPPATGKGTTAAPKTFGGQPIKPVGTFYRGARATWFGGKSDPDDNGLSAFGGTTGPGGREGVAIPEDVLKANFPGKDKPWLEKNVRVLVKTKSGIQKTFQLADLGTAEWVWEREKRPVLDFTPGAAHAIGASTGNLPDVDFAITSVGGPVEIDLSGKDWDDAKVEWIKGNPTSDMDAMLNGLANLRAAWMQANAELPERPRKAKRSRPAGPSETASLPDYTGDQMPALPE